MRSSSFSTDATTAGFKLEIEGITVATYIEQLRTKASKPTVKQHLAAIRLLFDYRAESARGISPRAAHRTGRKPLDLSGSCHSLKAVAFRYS